MITTITQLGANRWMLIALLALLLFIFFSLRAQSRNRSSQISLDDLLLGDDGKMSKGAAVMFGSFFLTSWIMVHLTITEHITEGYFTAYLAAWVAPSVVRLITNRPQPATSATSETMTSTKTIIPSAPVVVPPVMPTVNPP